MRTFGVCAATCSAPNQLPSTTEGEDPDDRGEALTSPEVVEGEWVGDRSRRPPQHRSSRLDVGYQESRYASPLPSPADLAKYQELLPDAPERLLAAGEREQSHRHDMEHRLAVIDEEAMPRFYEGQKRAHWMSLIIALCYLGLMLPAILLGQAFVGIGGAAAGLAAMIWALRRDPSDSAPPPSPPNEDPSS